MKLGDGQKLEAAGQGTVTLGFCEACVWDFVRHVCMESKKEPSLRQVIANLQGH